MKIDLNKIAFKVLTKHSFHMLYKFSTRSLNIGVVIFKDLLQEGDSVRKHRQVGVCPVRDALGQDGQYRHPHFRSVIPQLEQGLEVEMLPVRVLGSGDCKLDEARNQTWMIQEPGTEESGDESFVLSHADILQLVELEDGCQTLEAGGHDLA